MFMTFHVARASPAPVCKPFAPRRDLVVDRGGSVVAQQGQVFAMKSNGSSGAQLWGYRYRTGGRGSRRVQRGGFGSEQDVANVARSPACWSALTPPSLAF